MRRIFISIAILLIAVPTLADGGRQTIRDNRQRVIGYFDPDGQDVTTVYDCEMRRLGRVTPDGTYDNNGALVSNSRTPALLFAYAQGCPK